MAANPITQLDYGVELIHGLMGSGKSFFAVRRCILTALHTRRPIYTNLPIKFRVMRRYMMVKGGSEVSNLIRQLDESHWRAFLARQNRFAKFREGLKKTTPADLTEEQVATISAACDMTPEGVRRLPRLMDRHFAAWFAKVDGPPILDGPDANWIPPTAVIVIDEVQHWHPMSKQAHDPNREDLLAYLTMIRHHCQWLWVITQDPTRIAIEFRRLSRYYWRVWDRGEDRLAWGIRFKHLRVRAMGYECSTIDQLENRNPDNGPRVERFTIIPKFPRNRIIYRLYQSHTNIVSPRAMMRDLRRAREFAGLSSSGHSYAEIAAMRASKEQVRKVSKVRRVGRLLRKSAVLFAVAVVGVGIGTGIGGGSEVEDAGEGVEVVAELPPLVWPEWTGIGSAPWVGGKRLAVGDRVNPRAVVDYIHPGGRKCVLRVDDAEWWLWEWPAKEPFRVGTLDDIRRSVERMERVGRDGADGGPVAGVGARGAGVVGAAAGDDLGAWDAGGSAAP